MIFLLKVKVIFLNGLEAVESQVIVGLGESAFSLGTKKAWMLIYMANVIKFKLKTKHARMVLLSNKALHV